MTERYVAKYTVVRREFGYLTFKVTAVAIQQSHWLKFIARKFQSSYQVINKIKKKNRRSRIYYTLSCTRITIINIYYYITYIYSYYEY